MTADAAFAALSFALQDIVPPCDGDPRFILEPREISRSELWHLSITKCRGCPVRKLCAAYGDAARPEAGIWAGKTYGPGARRRQPKDPNPAATPAALTNQEYPCPLTSTS
ncbi:WhiB family transcriptional regulator [Microbacterium caowuchunii]|uniref:4Fe-4S Wbl-type domain-containing protein n=1 Tax=Microbacterium caowuchunii TaxID=2614638 RepID=A0A5N0TGK0_9MICO|nr:WhiB family transcriptional regulator [Microbacterium caowuchunii]KAA9133711.1 hypothetical protein F6B40_08130 [Microbacterium caowuchunii]